MRKNNLLGSNVDLNIIAKELKNYTGAEIEAIVKSANSFALNRHHNLMDFSKNLKIDKPGQVEMEDFLKSMDEVKPEFGVDDHKMDIYSKAPLFSYG